MRNVFLATVSAVVLGVAGSASAQEAVGFTGIGADGSIADLTVLSDTEATSSNLMQQRTLNQSFELDVITFDGATDSDIDFADGAFAGQTGNVNGLNTGLNSAQQGAGSLAVGTIDVAAGAVVFPVGAAVLTEGANVVSLNAMSQITTNQAGDLEVGNITTFTEGGIEFSPGAFSDQTLNVNAVNTGVNSAQQGAISIAVSTGSVF